MNYMFVFTSFRSGRIGLCSFVMFFCSWNEETLCYVIVGVSSVLVCLRVPLSDDKKDKYTIITVFNGASMGGILSENGGEIEER